MNIDQRTAAETRRRSKLPRVNEIPPGHITSTELLDRTGISASQLRGIVARGLLRASFETNRGWCVYKEEDVQKVRQITKLRTQGSSEKQKRVTEIKYTTEEGESVVALIKAGRPMDEIFLETHIHPVILRYIREDYEEMCGSITVPKAILDRMNALSLPGDYPLRTPEAIIAVMEKAAQESRCVSCKQRPQAFCTFCVKRKVAGAKETTARAVKKAAAASPPREDQESAAE